MLNHLLHWTKSESVLPDLSLHGPILEQNQVSRDKFEVWWFYELKHSHWTLTCSRFLPLIAEKQNKFYKESFKICEWNVPSGHWQTQTVLLDSYWENVKWKTYFLNRHIFSNVTFVTWSQNNSINAWTICEQTKRIKGENIKLEIQADEIKKNKN